MRDVPMGGIGVGAHRSVLVRETMGWLAVERGGLFVDATLGLGGHSEAILEASPKAQLIGIDRDPEALRLAHERLGERFGKRFRAVQANFSDIARVVEAAAGGLCVNGVIADFGVSSLQLDTPQRGFSFRHDAPLDMRMDNSPESVDETAAELLLRIPEEELARIIYEYGEERASRRIARWVVERREQGDPVRTTADLAALVARAVGYRSGRADKIHPATRTFQGLRIAVNQELAGLAQFIEDAIDLLQPGGRFVAISFHSLEDRAVKQTLRLLTGRCECSPRAPFCSCQARRVAEILTRRPVVASPAEINENPRARSAKLRACVKLDAPATGAES
ncbi:MAG: 16S rRNA (cytosine(1402)-N(4))-methyltransferase RsmH [Pyrinomonadaceae bacterium]